VKDVQPARRRRVVEVREKVEQKRENVGRGTKQVK